MFKVVPTGKVRQNGTSFKNSQITVVVVHDSRNTPVRIDICEPPLLLNVLGDVNALPGIV